MADLLGTGGVSLILIAYFLNLFDKIEPEHLAYILMNLVGAGLACWSSVLIKSMPFTILEEQMACEYIINWSNFKLRGTAPFFMADPFKTYVQDVRSHLAAR